MPRPMRSFLFAPGNRPRMLEKVGHCGADAVILDLEDAVPISEKEATRQAVRGAVGAIDTCPVYVRINPLVAAAGFSQPIGEADLAAIIRPRLGRHHSAQGGIARRPAPRRHAAARAGIATRPCARQR